MQVRTHAGYRTVCFYYGGMTVIKKICQVIDGEYVCDIDISVEEWKILLMNEKVFDSKSIAALKKWFIEPSHSCTCFDIGKSTICTV